MVEFQILGPVRVVDKGSDLTPVRPKQRALLAVLLLHRDNLVPGALLVEALWGAAPPVSAQSALHGHVSSLRKLLGADRVRTRPPGCACWAYLDGRWHEAVAIASELIAAADAGEPHYSDALLLSLRGWIAFACGDTAAADRDSKRAAELARASDLQAQAQAYTIRAAVALATGGREEANELASDLAAVGPPIAAAICTPSVTLTDMAWVFHGLDRASEFAAAVLDRDPIKGPWNGACRAIVDRDLARVAEIIDRIGHPAAAAYARLRAAEALSAAGQYAEAAALAALAQPFYRDVSAARFVRDCERIGHRATALSAVRQ